MIRRIKHYLNFKPEQSTMYIGQSFQTKVHAKLVVEAYLEWAEQLMARGFSMTLLTFMFKKMHGTERSIAARMDRGVEQVYASALRRTIRLRNSTTIDDMPVWFACADWPVPKAHKDTFRDLATNDGQHRHAIALTPPCTRFRGTLAEHVTDNQAAYAGAGQPLSRLHALDVVETPNVVARYALKSLSLQRIEIGDVQVLPWSESERTSHRDRLREKNEMN